jgi:23S rRNA (pseudouridine1915-N3)-methyltransferase
VIKIEIIAIGKDKDNWVTKGIEHYTKLISRFAELNWNIIPNLKDNNSLSSIEIKRKEADLIYKKLNSNSYIALTDKGDEFDSVKFAENLDKLITTHQSRLIIVIGGAYGLDEKILNKASYKLSLSRLTFSHQLVRLVLMEQIYRAFSILNNTDYHK